jgi:hypothetical protein
LGWIAAILASLAAIFRGTLEDVVRKLVNSFGESLYNRFAGSKPFWRLALRRYKESLHQKHHELKLPFRPGRPLLMKEVYVPVKLRERDELTDAYQAIKKHKKLVMLGAPRAGKSILLRHVALTYAERDFDAPLVPVLVELNRLNDTETNMFAHLAAILKQNNFPNSEIFLKSWLKAGQLLLMFDGIDEVNTDRREQVSVAIRDLLTEYPGCHAIVTCRTQVYKGEFADWADQTLEVAEFSDQQIQRFLFAWQKELPPGKSVEHLWANMSERPRILALARNPLMLTIITFLYADTEFVLPHSRTEFYDTIVTVLLEQWKEKRNRYKAAIKRLVMRHLALFMQDTAAEREQERRTIDLPVLLAEIRKMLPALNLKNEDALILLDEIVERSGLMIALEGGLKYQFTHLTLQEFFAAQALIDDYQGLLRRFDADPDTWREVVKLWCAFEYDSTEFINSIYKTDPFMALECIIDAKKVDTGLVEQIISVNINYLGKNLPETELIIRLLAILTRDPRHRGKVLLDRIATLMATVDKPLLYDLARILFLSQSEIGIRAIAQHLADLEMRSLIIRMGDLAVPVLTEMVAQQSSDALFTLATINTELAKEAMASLGYSYQQIIESIKAVEMLDIYIEKSSLVLQEEARIELRLKNISMLPLSGFTIKLEETSKYSCKYKNVIEIKKLDAGKDVLVEFTVQAKLVETLLLQIKINDEVYKKRSLEVFFYADRPYVWGVPIQNSRLFFGRQDKVARIVRNCLSSNGAHTLIVGEQRSGKTSLMNQAISRISSPSISVYISLSSIKRPSATYAAEWFLKQIVENLKKQNALPENFSLSHLSYSTDITDKLREILQGINLLKEKKFDYLVLFIDEGHLLIEIEDVFQESLRQAFADLISEIRVVFACYYNFHYNVVASGSPLFNMFETIRLEPLAGNDLRNLITKPAKSYNREFTEDAIAAIEVISGGHPYFCQCLCAKSFVIEWSLPAISIDNVRQAEKQVILEEKDIFRIGYWATLSNDEKLFLGKLASKKLNQGNNITKVPISLSEKYIIKKIEEKYCFTSQLFETWSKQLYEEERIS